MVHILGHAPTTSGTFEPPPAAGAVPEWTVYVVEPHGNAVFADARLGAGFVPTAWAADINADYPASDRQELLVFNSPAPAPRLGTGRIPAADTAHPVRHE
jgi:hypothetical protein